MIASSFIKLVGAFIEIYAFTSKAPLYVTWRATKVLKYPEDDIDGINFMSWDDAGMLNCNLVCEDQSPPCSRSNIHVYYQTSSASCTSFWGQESNDRGFEIQL
jgi:hypothetical protein